jgi:hypothetical protein
MGTTITMAVTMGLTSIGISTGGAATNVATGSGRSEAGTDTKIVTSGVERVAITMLIDGRGIATGRAPLIGVGSDSMTTRTSVIGTITDTFGIAVSDCRLPITRPRTSCVTTPPTSFGNPRMVAGGFELTITLY